MRAFLLILMAFCAACGGSPGDEPAPEPAPPPECSFNPGPGWDIGCESVCRATPADWDPATRSVRLRCPVCIWEDGVNRTTGSVEVGATCEQRVRGDRIVWTWVSIPMRHQ